MKRNNLLTLIISLIISLIILEIGLRKFTPYPISRGSNRVEHDELGHIMDPKMSEIDEKGFRNEKLTSVDIVALGDSHTYGFNVSSDNSWPKLLGRKLKKNVYNFGVGGYGILQYQNLLSKAIELNPEVILLGLYLPNDLNDICLLVSSNKYRASKAKEFHIDSSLCPGKNTYFVSVPKANGKQKIHIVKFLKEKSAIVSIGSKFYNLISTNKRINAREQSAVNKIEKGGAKNDALVINDGKIKTIIAFDRIKINKECMNLKNPHIQMGYEVMEKFFSEAGEKTQLKNISFGVLFIPSKERVFYNYLTENGYSLPKGYEELVDNEDKLKRMTSAFLKKAGIPFIDVLPDMEKALRKYGDLYPAWDDGHTILIGYEVFAQCAFNLYQQIISSTGSN